MTSLREFSEYVHNQSRRPPMDKVHPSIQTELDVLASLTIQDKSESKIIASSASFRECLLDSQHGQQLTELIKRLLLDGHGECILPLWKDPDDSSVEVALTRGEFNSAVENIKQICSKLTCTVTELYPAVESDNTTVRGTVLIREKIVAVSDMLEIRVAVVGNVDAGKSTLLGVLTKGGLDDGRGKARVNLFRFKHELETGRTSSVGMEIMGFDDTGKVVGANDGSRKSSWRDIVGWSKKVITFIDLAGHEKYLKTTVFGLMGGSPDYVMLMVGANAGMVGMAREHLGVALALNVPVFVCVTKVDMCPPNVLQATLAQLGKILRSAGCRKMPIFISSLQDVADASPNFVSQRICPIFQISSVSGQGLDYVRSFLNLLPFYGQFDDSAPFEFEINDTFSVPFVGTVVSGVVTSGTVQPGDSVYIGPDSLGQFTISSIRSIERKRQPVTIARAGQSVSFAMKKLRRKDVRKGMVVLAKHDGSTVDSGSSSLATSLSLSSPPKSVREFVAEVLILQHATTIKIRYQAMLHVGAVAQTCAIVELDRPYIRTGDRALVKFRFILRPEYIKPGQKILFREGRTRGLGVVKEVIHGF
ncbi:P-loop containing nucleoside triphosphate hydrolase protein [Lipomyces oligophaga]|uniref:P-loop containing nucleoside triphosphate hydrolase protein n=1 Tax=Lipomyces oligophaga TaxID=45792 RepID=UPI0034CEFB1D